GATRPTRGPAPARREGYFSLMPESPPEMSRTRSESLCVRSWPMSVAITAAMITDTTSSTPTYSAAGCPRERPARSSRTLTQTTRPTYGRRATPARVPGPKSGMGRRTHARVGPLVGAAGAAGDVVDQRLHLLDDLIADVGLSDAGDDHRHDEQDAHV